MTTEVRGYLDEIEKLKSEVFRLECSLKSANADVDEQATLVSLRNDELDGLNSEYETVIEIRDKALDECDALNAEIERLKEENTNLRLKLGLKV